LNKAALADLPEPLHIGSMPRFVVPIFLFGTAIMVASIVASVAHDGLGIPSGTIRTDALASVLFVGAILASSILLQRNK
jgi:hypothetical protein